MYIPSANSLPSFEGPETHWPCKWCRMAALIFPDSLFVGVSFIFTEPCFTQSELPLCGNNSKEIRIGGIIVNSTRLLSTLM